MQNIIPLLKPIAPTLARVFDGPFHALAHNYIINHLPEALVLDSADDEAQLHALLADPSGLQALKTMDGRLPLKSNRWDWISPPQAANRKTSQHY